MGGAYWTPFLEANVFDEIWGAKLWGAIFIINFILCGKEFWGAKQFWEERYGEKKF